MTPDQKAKTARILGYICVVAGALNLAIAGVLALQGQAGIGSALLVTGVVAVSMGVLMLARGKQKLTSQG